MAAPATREFRTDVPVPSGRSLPSLPRRASANPVRPSAMGTIETVPSSHAVNVNPTLFLRLRGHRASSFDGRCMTGVASIRWSPEAQWACEPDPLPDPAIAPGPRVAPFAKRVGRGSRSSRVERPIRPATSPGAGPPSREPASAAKPVEGSMFGPSPHLTRRPRRRTRCAAFCGAALHGTSRVGAVPAFGRRVFLAASGGSGPEGPRTRRTTPMGARFRSATVMASLRSMRFQQRPSLRASACSGCADLLVRFREKRPPRSGDRLDRRPFHGTTSSLRAQRRPAVGTCMELPVRSGAGLRRQRTGRSAHPENDPDGGALPFCNRDGVTAIDALAVETLPPGKRVLRVRGPSGPLPGNTAAAKRRPLGSAPLPWNHQFPARQRSGTAANTPGATRGHEWQR